MRTKIYILHIFTVLLVLSSFVFGQERLIYPVQVSNRTERTNVARQRGGEPFVSVSFVGINAQSVFNSERFTMQFGEENITVVKERINLRGDNSFTFIGRDGNGNSIVMSVLDGDIQGTIETNSGVFSIITIEEDVFAIIKVDQSRLREGCENLQEEVRQPSALDSIVLDVANDYTTTTRSAECKIRVLILYTPNAKSSVSNIKNTALTAIALTNQSFVNSNINCEIELAYVNESIFCQ